jgi:hypothetical protein
VASDSRAEPPQPVGSRLFEVTLADHLPAGASDAGMKRGIVEALALWPQLDDERFELDGRHVSCDGRNERLRQGEAILQGTSARFLYDPTENGGSFGPLVSLLVVMVHDRGRGEEFCVPY